jgi:hypothetical protein
LSNVSLPALWWQSITTWLKPKAKAPRDFRRFHYEAVEPDTLPAVASNRMEALYYGHDGRGAWKWLHYLELYDRHLSRFCNRPTRVLELGILRGGSLQLWEKYFGNDAVIHGIDIDPGCAVVAESRIVPHIGNQADAQFLQRVVDEMGGIDIAIDEGGHQSSDQIATFEALYPLLDVDGVYICEDTRASYWAEYGGGYRKRGTFIEYAKALVDQLHAWYIEDGTDNRDESFARMTLGIFFYDSMVVIEKRAKNKPFQCIVGRKES